MKFPILRILFTISIIYIHSVITTNTPEDCSGVACAEGEVCVQSGIAYLCSEDYCTTAGSPCQNGGTCSNSVTEYVCDCDVGYEGNDCEINIDDCDYSDCLNGATCVDGIDSYTCDCVSTTGVAAYTGDHCETVDYCVLITFTPCRNLGECINLADTYECNCDGTGFTGDDCSTAIDDCPDPDPCLNGGECIDQANAYTCGCPSGYAGATCEFEIDECLSVLNCLNGTCTNSPGSYDCACNEGWQGQRCDEINFDECEGDPCEAGGTCTDGYNSYTCECIEHYRGDSCEFAPNDINYWTTSPDGCNCTDLDTLAVDDPIPDSCACCRDEGCACSVTIAHDQCVICADEQALMDDWCENFVLVNYTEILVSTTPMAEEATGDLGDTNAQSDKKDQAEPFHEKYRIFIYVGGGALLLGVVIIIVCVVKHRKKKPDNPYKNDKPKKIDIDEEDEESGRRNRRRTRHCGGGGDHSRLTDNEQQPNTSPTPRGGSSMTDVG